MYDKTATIFNYYESATTGYAYWYSHALSDVDLNTDKGAIIKKYGPDSADNAELHVIYTESNGNKMIATADGKLIWMPPKEWNRQINNELPNTITFGPDDFFIEGNWTEKIVDDNNYREGFYSYMNERYDFVFKISSVGGPYTVIPHFEILAK